MWRPKRFFSCDSVNIKGGKTTQEKDIIFDLGDNFKRDWSAAWPQFASPRMIGVPASAAQAAENFAPNLSNLYSAQEGFGTHPGLWLWSRGIVCRGVSASAFS